jgi:hypothetical protein
MMVYSHAAAHPLILSYPILSCGILFLLEQNPPTRARSYVSAACCRDTDTDDTGHTRTGSHAHTHE